MNDMSKVIEARSDQLNADDMISGPRTITITSVDIKATTEQPVTVHYEGENGRPWRPCKTTSRVLVHFWGPDANQYVGRSVTLFRDPSVKWGGLEVGGIRISHMSGLQREASIPLTVTRGNKKMSTIKPLKIDAQAPQSRQEGTNTSAATQQPKKPLTERVAGFKAYILARPDAAKMKVVWDSADAKALLKDIEAGDAEQVGTVKEITEWFDEKHAERVEQESAAKDQPAQEPEF